MNIFTLRELNQWKDALGFYAGRLVGRPLVAPDHVYFNLTNRCNLRCKMCEIPGISSKIQEELALDDLKRIIDEVGQLGVRHIIFSGGEPFLKEGLREAVSYAIARGIEMVDIITNGTLLKEEDCVWVVDSGVNNLSFSLDGLNGTNDLIRGPGVFEKVKAAIEMINGQKALKKSSFPTLIINFTVMKTNIDDIVSVARFAFDHKCSILFQPLMAHNTKMYETAASELWPDKKDLEKLKKAFLEINRMRPHLSELNIFSDPAILKAMPSYFAKKKVFKKFHCYEAIKRIVVSYDGVLWSCFGVYGNLKNKSLLELWHCPKAQKIRRQVKKCRDFCMQDCIYQPTDIFGKMNSYFHKMPSFPSVEINRIKDGLSVRVDALTKILEEEIRESAPGLGVFSLKKNLRQFRNLKKKIQKIS